MAHRTARPERHGRGALAAVAVVVVLVVVAVLSVRWVVRNTDVPLPVSMPWGPECAVWTGQEHVRLDRDQARRATTAAAVAAQGDAAPIGSPDTSDIPDEVMTLLEEGPEEDAGPSLSCRSTKNPDLRVQEELEPSGLTARAQRLKDGMDEHFAELSTGGYHPGGFDTGHGEDSAHYDGRAIDVFYRPVNEENRRAGWVMAHWLIAHAPDYAIDVIIFDDRIWSTSYPSLGWRRYEADDPDNEILRHLDHVHVDVQEGRGSAEAGG
ncbi:MULTISPECIES: hypothetical protein [unclassified Nocardiopsis]|uniref:hypothetical protein n=1 Tax=unclassified Nocardiopsis TaxID=2649073 RepID=UPI00135692A3|nr:MULTISPECIES: hypothetical protein [unclassified Nocardiopsis]